MRSSPAILSPLAPLRITPARDLNLRRFLMRFVRALTLTLLGLIALSWLFAPAFLAGAYLRPPRSPVADDPSYLGFPVEKVEWRGRDGVVLRAWLGRVSSTTPVILLGHGYPGTREGMVDYARFLYRGGYSVLLMDFRGWGESGGDQVTFGAREVGDISAAIDYLYARPDLEKPAIGGLGVSMGAGLLLLAAAQDPRLRAVVLDSSYTSILPAIEQWNNLGLRFWPHRLYLAPTAGPAANLMLDGRLYDLDPLAHAHEVSPGAILVVHAAGDTNGLTPPEGARRIYEAAREPRELAIMPRGGHAGVYAGQPEEYERRVLEFFAKYLR